MALKIDFLQLKLYSLDLHGLPFIEKSADLLQIQIDIWAHNKMKVNISVLVLTAVSDTLRGEARVGLCGVEAGRENVCKCGRSADWPSLFVSPSPA